MSETPAENSVEEPIKLVIVDQSRDAADAARDQADRRLDQELGEGTKLAKFVKSIWKGSIAKDFYRQQYIKEAQQHIESTQDVLTYDATPEARSRAIQATIDRYQGEYDELIHTDAGEHKEVQDNDSELAVGMKDLIRRYTEGSLNDETLPEERTRLLEAYRETHGPDSLGEGIVTIDNLMAVTKAVAGAVEHGESLDHVLENMQVITGEARTGVRTEARYNTVDKAINWLAKSKIGSILPPDVLIASATIGLSIARFGSHSVVGAVTKTILPGLAAGGWAALRENKRVKDERSQHSREMAQGREYEDGSKRRDEMEKTRYETISAPDLTEHLRGLSTDEVLDTGGNDALQAALDAIAAIEVRVHMSDRQNIDLISYTDTAAVGDERLALDIARAEVKQALSGRLDVDARRALGLDETASVADILAAQSDQYQNWIEDNDMSPKDVAFKKLKARRVATAAGIGIATGLVGGIVVQEAIAAADPTRFGLVEQLWGGATNVHIPVTDMDVIDQHQTILEGLVEGDQTIVHTGPGTQFETESFATNSELAVSDDHSIIDNKDGTFSLVDPNGKVTAENIAINPDGTMPQQSIDQLTALGMNVQDNSFDKQVTTTVAQQVSADQFVVNHAAEATSVTRDLWYGNDTAGVYDQNELRVYWGGNAGLIDGGYQLSAAGMFADGSYQDGQSVDWNQAAANGELAFAVSATVDSQTQVFMIPIGPDGAINIPADSPAGHFFGTDSDGHATFNGAYGEVVQTTGVDENGVTHMRPLATLVGDESATTINDMVTTTVTEHHAEYAITTAGFDTVQNNFTEMAPVTPIVPRRSLEALKNHANSYYYRGGEFLTSEEIARRREETSPRLIDNPDQRLNPKQEYEWYKKLVLKKRGKEYVKDIDRIIAASPELSRLSSDIKTIVKVPVNASGKAESENIYNVLTHGYGEQVAGLDSTLILLHVNWFDDYEGDQEGARANIEHTRSEIERAKIDNPTLNIAVIETEWKRSEVQGGVIGHVSRKMNDVTLLALEAATASGRMDANHEVLLVRNDSDPTGVSVNYLEKYIKGFEENSETDIFTGTTTFDNTKASQLPGLVFVGNFMQSFDLLASKREGSVHTGGANFGVRASTFAAVGATGFNNDDTGAGTDDVNVGRRIKSARDGIVSSRGAKRNGYFSRRFGYKRTSTDESTDSTVRKLSLRVDARVDTDSDRQEKLYQQGIPIIYSWNPEYGFDKDGYSPRDSGLYHAESESFPTDSASVIERIRNDMEGTINMMSASSSTVETALTFAFLGAKTKGYDLRLVSGGKYKLTITPAGAKYLENHLTRDVAGKYDPYGNRKLRQLYGQAKPGLQRVATHRQMIRI